MDTYFLKCTSCLFEIKVKASSEKEAKRIATDKHNNGGSERHGCLGPMWGKAWNLDKPSHPCAPRQW